MALSIHDSLLISYSVQCDVRTILLRTEHRVKGKPSEFVDVIFEGVQGYFFENDAFANIIFGLDTISIAEFLREHGKEILESYRMAGAPGPWAANLETATSYLLEQKIQAYELSSSLGLSGWILAREASFSVAQPSLPANSVDMGTF